MFYHPTFTPDQYDPLQSDLAWLLVYCLFVIGLLSVIVVWAMDRGLPF